MKISSKKQSNKLKWAITLNSPHIYFSLQKKLKNVINRNKIHITMELKNIFRTSSNEILESNNDLLEEHDLLNILGSPNKLFLRFLNSKNININEDEITEELIEEFENSIDSINLKQAKIEKQKEIIFKQEKVWINILKDNDWIGTDLLLTHEGIIIQKTNQKLLYSQIDEITISEGGWSKNKVTITTDDGEVIFEINEDNAIPLKEILESNISNQHDDIDDLIELYNLFEEGKISEEEFEVRKAIIYSDDVYCTECGEKLDLCSEFCSNCGHKID